MIFDVRKTGLLRIADAAHEVALEHGQAHVYVSGYVVTILHEWRPLPSWIGSYDKRAAAEHVMDDISAEIGATRRRRK